MICNCILNEFELWMCYKIFYFGLVYSGLCWVLNKICRFKCENNTKTETALKKHHIRPRFIPEPRQKAHIWCRVEPKPRPKGDRIIKNKLHIWLRVEPKPKQKVGSMASGAFEPRQKRALWLRFSTEAKSYPLLASPQYASVREPMQNIKNNRCQSPFLHWCMMRLEEILDLSLDFLMNVVLKLNILCPVLLSKIELQKGGIVLF